MEKHVFLLRIVLTLSLGVIGGLLWATSFPASADGLADDIARPVADCVLIDADVSDVVTTWTASCYRVMTNTVTVLPTATLVIDPPGTGTRIEFVDDARLQVQGKIHALGTATSPISFTSVTTPCTQDAWIGISLDQNSTGSYIEHALIECARTGVKINDTNGITITSSTFRYNGDSDTYVGAIGGDTDGSYIAGNTIHHCTNGIILSEAFDNRIANNTFYTITRHAIAFIEDTTAGGSGNEVLSNTIYAVGGDGIRMEDSGGNVVRSNEVYRCTGSGIHLYAGNLNAVLSNTLYLNRSGALYLDEQTQPTVRYNYLYHNGGAASYPAALYVTGASSIIGDVADNVIYDAFTETVEYAAGSPLANRPTANNALCALNGLELVNRTGATVNAPRNRWGTPEPDLPAPNQNYAGPLDITSWITLAVDVDAGGLVTVSLRDAAGATVPPPLPASVAPELAPPHPRRIALSTNWGTLSPATVTVDAQGFAVAQLSPGAGPAPGDLTLTATDFCNEVATGTVELPDLVITKTAALTQTQPGELITYTLHYRNAGEGAAHDVRIVDALPPGTAYVADTSGLPCSGCAAGSAGPLTWDAGSLPAPGAEESFSLTLSAGPELPCGTALTNTATITTSTIERTTGNNAASAGPLYVVGADLRVTKTSEHDQIAPGETLTYTLAFSNVGGLAAQETIVRDTLPAHTSYLAGSANYPCPACTPGSTGPLTWSVGTLLPHRLYSITLVLQAEPTTPPGTQFTNAAAITSSTHECAPGDNGCHASSIPVTCADVTIVKDALQTSAYPGDMLTYTLTYFNAGQAPASGVAITDTLPEGALYVDYSGGASCSGCVPGSAGPLVWDTGTLPAGVTPTLTLTLRLTGTHASGTWITNTAAIATTAPECPGGLPNEDRAGVPITGGVNLITVKDDDIGPTGSDATLSGTPVRWLDPPQGPVTTTHHRAFAFSGDLVTYTIAVVNEGNATATGVVLTENLPEHSSYVGHGWTYAGGGTYSMNVGDLPPGTGVVRYFVVRVDEPLPPGVDLLDNLVCAVSSQPDRIPGDNCNREDTPLLRRPRIDKTFTSRFGVAGQLLTFTVAISNPNALPIHDLLITDTLPQDTLWVGDTALDAGWTTRTHAVSTVTWYTPTLAPGAISTFTLNLRYDAAAEVCGLELANVVTLTVRNGDFGAYFADRDAADFTIECPGDLVVVKDDRVGPTTPYVRALFARLTAPAPAALQPHRTYVLEGDLVTYTIAIENVGPYTVTNVVLTETLPLYTDYVGGGWIPAGGRAYTLPIGTLLPGEGGLYFFVVRVHDVIPEEVNNLINHVCGWGDAADLTPEDNCNYEDTPVRRRPLHVAKSAPLCIAPGDTFNYTPRYTNTNSTTDFARIPMTDTLPAYVSYVGATPGNWQCDGQVCTTEIPSLLAGASGSWPNLLARLSPTVPYTRHPVITNTIEISGGRRFVLARTIDTGPDLEVVVNDNVGPLPLLQRRRWARIATRIGFSLSAAQQREYVTPGELITYTIAYVNTGVASASDVVITEYLPEHTHYYGGGWSHERGDRYSMPVGTLRPGEGGEVPFIVQVDDPFPIGVEHVIDVVRIDTPDPECDLSNNSSNDHTPVRTSTRLYVVNRDSRSVDVFDTTTFAYETSFDVGPEPFGILAYEGKIYVASFEEASGEGTVYVYDWTSYEHLTTITVGRHPTFLTALGDYVYVANHSGGEGITVIEHATGEVVARLLDFGFFGITRDTVNQRVYATKRYAGDEGIWSITPTSDGFATVHELSGSEKGYAIAHNPATNKVYATYPQMDEMRVYTPTGFALLDAYATEEQDHDDPGQGGHGLVTMEGCTYVANFRAQSISILAEGPCASGTARAPSTAALLKQRPNDTIVIFDHHVHLPLVQRNYRPYPHVTHVPMGGRPKGMVGGPGAVIVTLPEQDRIAVIDTRTLSIIATFDVHGDYPHTAELIYHP